MTAVLVGAALAALGFIVLLLVKWSKLAESSRAAYLPATVDGTGGDGPEVAVLSPLDDVLLNPLRDISFEKSLDPALFSSLMVENVERDLMKSARSASGLNGVLQVDALANGGYIVRFNEVPTEFVRTADGVVKAQARAAGGQFGEIGHIDAAATWMNRLSQTTALVVTIAHIISGADVSKRLATVADKLNLVLAYRRCDQYAELQMLYEELRRMLGGNSHDANEAAGIRREIRRIRHTLKREIDLDLNLNPLRPPAWNLKKLKNAIASREGTRKHSERAEALDHIIDKSLLGMYCLQLENLCTAYVQDELFQASLVAEAADGLRGLEAKLMPLERELRSEGDVQTHRAEWIAAVAASLDRGSGSSEDAYQGAIQGEAGPNHEGVS